ncbi:MAG TPA: HhH-GPD-type base excision DNA repair protein [Gaiellales bacterium]|nr:HhH-GPD-type base excision DNA repair protein [Gaiellales bacterium]
MSSATAPATLPWTEDDEANRLLAGDGNALLIGFALDQQVTVQKAFAGPLALKQRLGTLDPGRIAAMPPDELEAVFREKPAIHRFPGAMAGRVQALCGVIADRYGGDGSRVWTEAASGADLVKRLGALPGIGDMKVRSLTATLVKQFGVRPEGWEDVLPGHPTLGDVDSPEALAEYQAAKRAHKAKVRAERSRT